MCVFSSQAGLSTTSESSLTCEDLTTPGKKQSPLLVSDLLFSQRTVEVFNVLLFSDDSGAAEKKKNCFQRLGSWMKKMVG